jgi:acyl carrier protein
LTAYVVNKPRQTIELDSLRTFLKEKLPAHMVPAFFVTLEKFPLTQNGKIDRAALPAPDKSRDSVAEVFVAPRTLEESLLAEMWSEVLGRGEISVHDNFFDLGGHSLLAAQVVARVSSTFGVQLPLRNFFDQPTVAALAVFVSESLLQPAESQPAIKRLPRS